MKWNGNSTVTEFSTPKREPTIRGRRRHEHRATGPPLLLGRGELGRTGSRVGGFPRVEMTCFVAYEGPVCSLGPPFSPTICVGLGMWSIRCVYGFNQVCKLAWPHEALFGRSWLISKLDQFYAWFEWFHACYLNHAAWFHKVRLMKRNWTYHDGFQTLLDQIEQTFWVSCD